jgi:hypothetical protein
VLRRAVQVSSRNDRPASEIREKDIFDLSPGFKRSHDWDPQKARFHKDSRTVEEEISQDDRNTLDGIGFHATPRYPTRRAQHSEHCWQRLDGTGAAFTTLLAKTLDGTGWAQHSEHCWPRHSTGWATNLIALTQMSGFGQRSRRIGSSTIKLSSVRVDDVKSISDDPRRQWSKLKWTTRSRS